MLAECSACALVQSRARSGESRDDDEAHLARCQSCRAVVAQFRHLTGELHTLRYSVATSDDTDVACAAILGDIRRAQADRSRRVRKVASVAGGIAVAGVAGALKTRVERRGLFG